MLLPNGVSLLKFQGVCIDCSLHIRVTGTLAYDTSEKLSYKVDLLHECNPIKKLA